MDEGARCGAVRSPPPGGWNAGRSASTGTSATAGARIGGGWSDWDDVFGRLPDGTAVAAGVTSIEVIAAGADGDLWQKSYLDATNWGEWRAVALTTESPD